MKKKRIRMIVDICMTVLLPILMAYSLIGEKFHEIAGTAMLLLFIAHHVINWGWFKILFKGRYNARRVFQSALNILLFVFMILQPISGILMSKHLYTIIHFPRTAATAREIHLLFAYWGFVLMGLHAGTHLAAPLGRLNQGRKAIYAVTICFLVAVSLFGCYAFVKRQLADYMFLKSAFVFFDFSEPRILFFLDYIAIMILFAFAGCLIMTGLTKANRHSRRKDGAQ